MEPFGSDKLTHRILFGGVYILRVLAAASKQPILGQRRARMRERDAMVKEDVTSTKEQSEVTEQTSEKAGLWTRLRSNRYASWGIDLTVMLGIFFLITQWQSRDLIGSKEPAPDFSLGTLDGRDRVSLESLKGKPTVLVLWAPWCGVCGAESSTISALRESVGDDANVISIALEYEQVSEVQGFVDKHEVDYPVLLGNKALTDAFKVSAFPTVYILDEEGKVSSSLVGYTSSFGFRWRLWLA